VKVATALSVLVLWVAGGVLVNGDEPPAIWIDVPFVAQSKKGCGSAAISMVMQYWAKQKGQEASSTADAAKIQELLFSPEQKGIPASAMEKYFREQGYRTFVFRGEWGDLLNHVKQGRPLIVSLKASGEHGPLHYAVVVGLDVVREYVFLNDPALGKMLRRSREGFQKEWDGVRDWTLLAVPAEEK
jgi:predicted double-glycine peptidase